MHSTTPCMYYAQHSAPKREKDNALKNTLSCTQLRVLMSTVWSPSSYHPPFTSSRPSLWRMAFLNSSKSRFIMVEISRALTSFRLPLVVVVVFTKTKYARGANQVTDFTYYILLCCDGGGNCFVVKGDTQAKSRTVNEYVTCWNFCPKRMEIISSAQTSCGGPCLYPPDDHNDKPGSGHFGSWEFFSFDAVLWSNISIMLAPQTSLKVIWHNVFILRSLF
jgi:hypothetical protein